LLDPAVEPRLRPLYNGYLDQAEEHLRAGWAYTTSLPRSSVRVRLACAWPVLIGFETLKLLRTGQALAGSPLKITRGHVRRAIRRTLILYPFARAWDQLAAPR